MGLVTCLRPVSPAHAPEPGRYHDQPPEGPAALPGQICCRVESALSALVWVDKHQPSSGDEVYTQNT